MAKKKNTLKPVGTYAQSINNIQQKKNSSVGSYQERLNSLNSFVKKARDEERKRQEEEQRQQRILQNSRKETENMKKLTQDLTYGYNGRYDPSLAYQAKMMGLKSSDVREEVNKSEQLYKAIDRANKEYNAQKDMGYAGVQKDRKIYNTGNQLTMSQWFRVKAKERSNQAEGLNDNGDDPFQMTEEGRKEYRRKAQSNVDRLKARAKKYEDYNEDDALAGLFDRIYERDIANEQAILDNPAYKGTDYETTAQGRKATLESSYEADRRRAVEYARRMRDNGLNLNADEAHMPQLRKEVYDWIMTDGYDQRTKNNKAEIDAIIDEYITGLRTPWDSHKTQAEAIEEANSMASAYESQVRAADEAQQYYDLKNKWIGYAADDTFYNASNEYVPEYAPQVKMLFDDTAQDFVPEVQGDEVAKAYWYANNWQNMNGLQDSLDYANKYMFIASDPDILRTFNEMYNKDMENGYRGERGSNLSEQFLKGLDPYLSTMLVNYQKDFIKSKAEDPVSGIPARILSPIMQVFGGLAGTFGAITGAEKDSKAYLISRVVSELRSQQNENVGEWADRVFGNGSGDVAKFMMGVVDSIADNVFAMGTGTALAGKGTDGAMRLVQLIMSGSATSNKMIENLDKGMSGTEAALSAVGSGIIEWLTERYSLERIMGPDIRQLYGNKRAMASFLARSAGAEGSEEIASGILETGLDSILSMVYGHEDEIKQRYNELITSDPRMTHEEATRIAMEEKLAEIGLEGLAGSLSGLGMAGSRVITTALETRAEGRNIKQEAGNSERIIDLAKNMKEGTESRALAEQLEKAAAEGKTIKDGDLGRLANLTLLDVGEERGNAIRETINRKVTQQLTDKGVSENEAATYSKIIEKSIFDGGRLTTQERKTLAQNEEAIKLFASYNTISKEYIDLRKDIKTNTKELDSIADQIGEMAGKTREADSAAAAEVQKSIQETGSMEEAIDNLQARRSGLLSEGYANLAKQVLQDSPLAKNSKNYLDDIMKIRLAAMTEDALPRTGLENDVAQKFYDAAKAEFNEIDQERVRPQAPAQEGKGTTTYNGAEYGTDAWKQVTQGLSKMTKNVMGAVGEIAARFGYRVNMINDPDNPDVYGFEDANTGAITINVANGFKHHMLVTLAHEMTHNLEQNSRGGYNDLRSYVLSSLRQSGVNVQDRLVKIMDNYNMVMGEKAGAGLNINQAMAELVAQSCEGLLSSRSAMTELQNTNPSLFGKVRDYVKNVVARIDAAIKSMEYNASLSYEAKALKNYRDQIADLWLKGRKEAQGQQGPITVTEEQAEEQTEVRNEAAENTSYSIREMDDGTKYVYLDTDQQIFDNADIKEYPRIIEKYITNKYKGQIVGTENRAYVDRRTAKEYAHPANKKIQAELYEAKGRSATELENLMDAAVFIMHQEDDGRHEEAINGWDRYKTIVYVPNTQRYYEGMISIEKVAKGDRFHDFTQLKDVTDAMQGRNASRATGNIPNENITDNQKINNAQSGNKSFSVAQRKADPELDRLYEELTAARTEEQEARARLKEIDSESKAWVDRATAAMGTGNEESVMAEYKKWEEEVYSPLSNRLSEANRRVKEANRAFDEYTENRDMEEEQQAIEKSGLSEPDYRRKQAVNEFGYTTDFREAGYMLPNGRMLNFTGEKGRHMGNRGQDHRAISTVYASRELQGGQAMIKFMADGNIRIMAETPGIDIIKEPTAEQYAGIRNMARRFAGEEYFNIDFTDEKGFTIDSIEYDGRVNADKIVNDIKHYFRTGEVPQQSTVSQFHYSIAQMDKDYQAAVDSGNVEEQQRLVDQAAKEAGYTIRAYHGTGRADRVGTVFLPERATSGPMAFFTDDREIAEGYARDKKDTSIAYDEEYGDYHTQFRYNLNGKDIPVSKLWDRLDWKSRQKIIEAAKHINFDDELEEIIYDEDAQHGPGGFTDNELRYHRGNAIDTLIYVWLDSANLWNREQDFLKVLDLAGIKNVKWNNPDARYEKVYDTYLKIQNPFDTTSMYTQDFIDGLLEWWEDQDQEKYDKESMDTDFWDKNNVSVEEWAEDARREIENGKDTHNWTRIPDAVSDYLKAMGYDGIKDEGGKNGGNGHTVWIPFTSEQIKSAEPVTYDDAGEVIPPSQRFNEEQKDIRYSITQPPDMEVNNFMMGLNEFNLPTYQEKTMLRQYKDSRTRAELLRYGIREREIERKKLLAKEKRGLKENKRLGEINRFLERDRAKLNSLEKELVRVTGEKGYARLMMNQENIMKNLTTGQSAADLEETVNNIQKNLDDVTAEMNERAEELKKLASSEAVVRIRQQFDSRGLKAIAAKLKNAIGSELENKEIENRLALIALKMKQGQYDAENAEELADLLAGRMKAEYDGYVISELRGSTITLGPAQLKELKGSGRTLNDIRQQLAGTGIRIGTTGNTTLDEKWEDLCKVMPTLDPNTNPGDMLDTILNLVNSEKSMRATVYSDENLININRQILEAAQQLIPEIITDEKSLKLIRESMALVAKVSGAAKSNAEAMDEVNAMINKLQQKAKRAVVQAKKISGDIESTIEYFDQLSLQSEAAMWKQERIRLIEQMKSDNTKALMEEADRWRERIEKDKAFREAVGENQLIRRKITTNTSRIRKLLINETDLKNIPEHMKGLAREMLGIIVNNDLAGRKVTNIEKQDLIETARVLAAMKELDGDYSPEDLRLIADEEAQTIIADALADLEEGLEEYNGRRKGAKDVNVKAVHDQLQKIQDAVAAISGIINAERSVSFLDRQVTVGEAADDVRRDFQNTRFKGELKGRGSKAATMAKRTVVYGNMTPEYYIDNLRNRGMTELWQDMKRGENRNGLEVRKAQEHIADLAAKTNYKAWADEKHDVILGGMKRNITIGNMMELYAIWRREQTSNPEMSQHLNKGGVYFQEEEKQTGKLRHEQSQQRAIRVTDEEIQAMYDSMTAEQKQLIDGVVKYLSNDMSDLGNEASMRMYGIKKYKETYYFPMKVWDGVKSARSDKGITGTDENRAAHKSWSKRRQHMARNALVIGDFMTDAVNHIVEMINYNTMAPSIENINKVLNYKFTEEAGTDNETQRNLRVMFRENYGLESLKYLEDLLKDLNGGPAQDQRKTLRDRLLSVFKKNAVAGSMSVALQQPLSYIRAAMMISPKYLAEGLTTFWKGSYEEMVQHSGVAVIKDMGRFDMNFGQSAKDYIMPETKKSLYNQASDVLTKAPELMDRMTWTRMWAAVKAEQAAKNPGMDIKSDAFMNKVTERFNELMRKTQVYDSILVKSSNMRSTNLGMKVITSFMAEPTLSLNVLADAIRNAGAEGGKRKLTKALATFLVSAIMQSGVKALMGSGRSPDKKKTWAENFLNKLQQNLMSEANPVSLVPGYSDIIEVLKTGELRDDAMGAIGKLFSIVETTRKAMEGNGKGAYRDVEDTVAQFAQLFTNVPAKNLMRDARAIYNWIAGSEYADRQTSSAVIKYQAEANRVTGDNLIGVLNAWLGEAGYQAKNASYYSRIYQATKNGNTGEADALKEFMTLAKGTSDQAMKTGLKAAAKKDTSMTEAELSSWMIENGLMDNTNTVTTQYKEGKITRAEAEKLYKEINPEISDNDLWWKMDRMDYQKETGADSVSGYSYRLKDAIRNNKEEEIKKVIDELLKHGRTVKQIKDALSDWKSEYKAADSQEKIRIRDAITKAYKALGLKAEDAKKVLDGWTKENKKTK